MFSSDKGFGHFLEEKISRFALRLLGRVILEYLGVAERLASGLLSSWIPLPLSPYQAIKMLTMEPGAVM